MGIVYYLEIVARFKLRLALLLAFHFHLSVELIQTLTKQKVVLEVAPHKEMHLVNSETITGANQSINVGIKTVRTVSLRDW